VRVYARWRTLVAPVVGKTEIASAQVAEAAAASAPETVAATGADFVTASRIGVVGSETRSGVAWALAAYAWWGVAPLYFKAVRHVAALEVLAHRIVWSVVVLAAIATALGRWSAIGAALRDRRTLVLLSASAVLIAVNWTVYIWAVAHERVLESSLGYFISPLATVLLGATVLRERLTRAESLAVIVAAAAVAYLTIASGVLPWVALALATSFATYGLVRKIARVDAIEALTVETTVLLLPACAYLAMLAARGTLRFGSDAVTTSLLASAGIITVMPLLWFGLAVPKLRLATLGILQYVGPTLQFLLAILAFHEPFGTAHVVTFAGIWIALAVYTGDNLRRLR
jgi:chloramphenicol-sensitive protein RarD